jgi:mono/diheme cytochrome c family protein
MAKRAILVAAALILVESAAAAQGMGMGMHMGRARASGSPDSTMVEQTAPAPSDSLAAVALAKVRAMFAEHCNMCHGGRRPSAGLGLSTDADLAALTQTTSTERDTLMLIAPGHPDASYLLMKIKGSDGIIGNRMPLGAEALSSKEVAMVEEWIRGLAVPDTAAPAAAGDEGSSNDRHSGNASGVK